MGMRLISQDGRMDIPYDSVIVKVIRTGDVFPIVIMTTTSGFDNTRDVVAEYDDFSEAINELSRLNVAHIDERRYFRFSPKLADRKKKCEIEF